MRLWTRNAAIYWKKRFGQTDWQGGQGLLLRTESNVALPEGLVPAQVFDLSDSEKGLNPETAARLLEAVQRLLQKSKTEPQTEEKIPEANSSRNRAEIQRLLDEINKPATEPPRRLAIGDRLAELGDQRPGVGVREIQVPVEPGIAGDQQETEFSEEIQAYLDEINEIKTEPPRRLQIGDEFARLGDPRKGVGLDANGLPNIDWVEIPGGSFIYQDGQKLELPTFYIARYPVTNAQYQAFVDAGVYTPKQSKKSIKQLFGFAEKPEQDWWQNLIRPEPETPRWPDPNRPKTNVNWYEAMAFCRWLSVMRGFEIRLPHEREREKAARGETGLVYPWGNEYRSGFANINETWGQSGPWNLEQTTAAGLYPHGASPYRVYDLAGNVWEWCRNKYEKPEVITADSSDDRRVLRGGSWLFDTDSARSDGRGQGVPDSRFFDVGFRVLSLLPIR
ncbi:MAG: formylglycine-generating enzyme family protein [Methylococcales bacterium]